MACQLTCGYSVHALQGEGFRGSFQVFDHRGVVVENGADGSAHATLQLAWASIWSLGQMAVSRLR